MSILNDIIWIWNTSFQAPRAKMNQQRSRRFRASKEGMEAAVEKQRVREEILAKGKEYASWSWIFIRCMEQGMGLTAFPYE